MSGDLNGSTGHVIFFLQNKTTAKFWVCTKDLLAENLSKRYPFIKICLSVSFPMFSVTLDWESRMLKKAEQTRALQWHSNIQTAVSLMTRHMDAQVLLLGHLNFKAPHGRDSCVCKCVPVSVWVNASLLPRQVIWL